MQKTLGAKLAYLKTSPKQNYYEERKMWTGLAYTHTAETLPSWFLRIVPKHQVVALFVAAQTY